MFPNVVDSTLHAKKNFFAKVEKVYIFSLEYTAKEQIKGKILLSARTTRE